MTSGVGVFVDVAWGARVAGRADFLFLRGILRGVRGQVIEWAGTLKGSV